jgi:hypothetical protein
MTDTNHPGKLNPLDRESAGSGKPCKDRGLRFDPFARRSGDRICESLWFWFRWRSLWWNGSRGIGKFVAVSRGEADAAGRTTTRARWWWW